MGGEFAVSLKKNLCVRNVASIPNLNTLVSLGKCPQKMHRKSTVMYKNVPVPVENFYRVKDKIYLFFVRYKTKDRNGRKTERYFSVDFDLNVDYTIFPRDVETKVMLELCHLLMESKVFQFYLGSGVNGYDDIDKDGFLCPFPLITKYISETFDDSSCDEEQE